MKPGDTVRSRVDDADRSAGFVFLWPSFDSYRPEDNRRPSKLRDGELGCVVDVQYNGQGTQFIRVISPTGNIGWAHANKLEVI